MSTIITAVVANPYLLLWLFGAVVIWQLSRNKKRLRLLGIVFLLATWIIGLHPTANAVVWPLERQFTQPSLDSLRTQNVNQVVVLTGGGYSPQGELLSSAFPHDSEYRFMAGLELCARLGPTCKLIFSGSSGEGAELPTGTLMQGVASTINPNRSVVSEANSNSTNEHPRNVSQLLDGGPFILVTSAYHMPRAVFVFRKAGLNPIPYPVDFMVRGSYSWLDLLPSADNVVQISTGLREYLATIFYQIRG